MVMGQVNVRMTFLKTLAAQGLFFMGAAVGRLNNVLCSNGLQLSGINEF